MKAPCRVVLDTNVVLSALVFRRGVAGALRPAWQSGVFVPLVSKVTAQELVRVLGYPKFRLTASDQEELLADYLPYAQTVRVPDPPPKVPDCRDPFDLPFLHLAVAGRAQVLVSGNLDVMSMASTFERLHGCPILSLDAFHSSHCVN